MLESRAELQLIFQSLITKLNAGGMPEVFLSGDTLLTSTGEVQQRFFAREKSSTRSGIPDMGAELIGGADSMVYFLTFFEGAPHAYGKTWVAENRFEAKRPGRGLALSVPGEMIGLNGLSLVDKYDPAIVQAAANSFGQSILYSRHISYGSPLHDRLLASGYQSRVGYPETMDIFFSPNKTLELG